MVFRNYSLENQLLYQLWKNTITTVVRNQKLIPNKTFLTLCFSETGGQEQESVTLSLREQRICGGHEVAVPTERLVQELDMPEENIATLLCYLELHDKCWLEVLQMVKSTCNIKCYGGYAQLRALAKKIPPIAAAFAYNEKQSFNKSKKANLISFPVVEIVDKMGWDLDPVCKELRSLQWNSSLAPNPEMASKGQSGLLGKIFYFLPFLLIFCLIYKKSLMNFNSVR